MSVTVLIPTLNAGRQIPLLADALARQQLPHAVTIIDSSSDDGTAALAVRVGWTVMTIPRETFGHGRTRNQAARAAAADVLVFLSQDVIPDGPSFLETLTAPIRRDEVAASYARQVAGSGAAPTERFLRMYNYSAEGRVRSAADIDRLGLQAFFFSDAAAAYRRRTFLDVGGFPEDTIQNEDMILCARLLRAGQKIAYVAEAVVTHTHRYSLGQQFRRYFDTGVAIADARGDLGEGASTGEGMRFVRQQIGWLRRMGYSAWIPYALAESAAKFVAYRLGTRHRVFPRWIKRRISYNPHHWRD